MTRRLGLFFSVLAVLALAGVPELADAASPKVRVSGGKLKVGGKTFRGKGKYQAAVGLPSGEVVAVRHTGQVVDTTMGEVDAGAVVKVNPKTGAETLLLKGRKTEDTETTLVDLAGIASSPNGRKVYVWAKTIWPATGSVWEMAPDGTGAKFLTPAGLSPGVVQKGPWKGFIFTTVELRFATGGSWFPPVLVDPATGQVGAVCRKAPDDQESLVADMVPLVPVTMLTFQRGYKVPKGIAK